MPRTPNSTVMRTMRLRSARSLLAVGLTAAVVAGMGTALGAPGPTVSPGGRLAAHGLPSVGSGHRPGPDILYAKPPRAPQLENTGVWHAKPILVSGAEAYRSGEWLYQDFLFDDHGATAAKDPNDPYGVSGHLYSPAGGTFTYPTAKVYANNAADLVELRVKPLARATAFRVTLDTLKDPARTAFTIALGNAAGSATWPHGAGVSSPASVFLTWHGSSAELVKAGTSAVLKPAPRVHVYRTRRQVQVLVPHAAWNPGRSKVRTTIGVGLWDAKAGSYLKPQPGSATETAPGGGTPTGVAIVNVGPRVDEPMPIFAGSNMGDTAVGGMALAPWWRDRMQSEQLTLGDLSPLSADVDFAKLAAKQHDDSGVPKTGPMDRIFASHYSFGQGLDPSKICYDLAAGFSAGAKCIGRFVGQLQNYALYVPDKPQPPKGFGLTLLLHSLSANYNQYLDSNNQSQLGDRGPGSIVLTPGGRGPDGFYAGVAEADTFEAWADVARHYRLDRDWTVVSGYSMGGFGTYRLLARWPDLFARGFSVVGAPGSVDDQLVSLRNTPLLAWNSTEDELVNIRTSEDAVAADAAAGIPFEEDLFLTADHLTLAANDEYGPGAAFLGTARVDRSPAHISYVVDSTEDSALARTVADHAYWLSGLAARGKGNATIDVQSEAFGSRPPTPGPLMRGAGALTGGEIPAMAYMSRTPTWIPMGPVAPNRDALTIAATNLARVVIDVRRARVTCGVTLNVKTDGPLTVVLAGCGKSTRFSG
ncbi:MAG: hypothetical protein QOJ03_1301 [Frankiaceae bacterium]|nr:hypothetical protein [Frankiaceae bacterium]